MIWPLRRLYKLFRYPATDVRRFGHAGIDLFELEGETLRCFGWFFDRFHSDTSQRWVSIYDAGVEIFVFPAPEIRRLDIASMLSIAEARNSGFDFVLHVETDRPLEVKLWYDSSDGRLTLPLGTVRPNEMSSNGHISRPLIYQIESADKIPLGAKLVELEREELLETDCEPVDIVIPVYNGMQYLDALFDGIKKTNVRYRLIVVDDCSPDKDVVPYLARKLRDFPDHIFIQNGANLGFVSSVNAGLAASKGDVVLLNTDVELPEQWLERLISPIRSDSSIASVTPFTNSGTICSFPSFCEDNTLLPGLSVDEEDALFRRYKPRYLDIPTGVGFCMAMSKLALAAVGVLDDVTFKRGYGEENDWCRRAAKQGFRNIHITNLFVFHNHGGSFPSEEKQMLMRENSLKLLGKHPEYQSEVERYVRKDPASIYRLTVLRDYIASLEVPTVVVLNHNLGGGADVFLKEKRSAYLSHGFRVIQINYDRRGWFEAGFYFSEYHAIEQMRSCEGLLSEISNLQLILVNELVTFPDLFERLKKIRMLSEAKSAPLEFMLHDYYALCPSYNLIGYEGKYCGLPSDDSCSRCLEKNIYANFEGVHRSVSIDEYRHHWEVFLQSCSEIVLFSESSLRLYESVYALSGKEFVRPHSVELFPEVSRRVRTDDTLRIGIAGSIAFIKGEEVIRDLVKTIQAEHRKIEICVIGATDRLEEQKGLRITGSYQRFELPLRALWEFVDIFFIPSICPETFSFTTHEIISMGYPIAVFNLGAPADRVASYRKGLLLDLGSTSDEILDQMERFVDGLKSNFQGEKKLVQLKNAAIVSKSEGDEGVLYESRIKLGENGWRTVMIDPSSIEKTDWSQYDCAIYDGVSQEEMKLLKKSALGLEIMSVEQALYSSCC